MWGRQLTGELASLEAIKAFSEVLNDVVIVTTAALDRPGPEIVYVNPAFTRVTGYAAEEVIGKTPRILQGQGTERAELDRMRRVLDKGETFFGRILNYAKDGAPIEFTWNISPVRDEEGKIAYWVSAQQTAEGTRPRPLRLQVTALLVHANALVRSGLRHILGEIATEVLARDARDLTEARRILRSSGPFDLVIGDAEALALDRSDGPLFADRDGAGPLVVLAAEPSLEQARRAVDAGARGYVPRSSEPPVIREIFRLVLAGGFYMPWDLSSAQAARPPAAQGNGTEVGASGSVQIAGLTRRQRDMLELLALGLSNEEIAGRLGLSVNTIKGHVTRTLKSVGVRSRTQAALLVAERRQRD